MSRQKFFVPPQRSKEERNRAESLYRSGKSYREISEALNNLPISTLRNWCRRHAWKITKPDTAIVTAASEELGEVPGDLPSQQEEYENNMRRAAVAMSRKVAMMPAEEIVQKADRIKAADQTSRRALRIESEKPFAVIQIGVLAAPYKVKRHKRDVGQLGAPPPTQLIEASAKVIEQD
jgi:hypothetical protein